MTNTPFIDCTTLDGQDRIRGYVLGWLERLDYSRKLQRGWPADELGRCVWDRVEREFSAVWRGPIVENRELSRIIAVSMVEDYYAAYPFRRSARYAVTGFLPDVCFRRCVLDFVNDLEEFEPQELSECPDDTARIFWSTVRAQPERWECHPELGPFVDDELVARTVAVEVIRDYFDVRVLAATLECREMA